jgi:hypothetical protein
MRRLAFVALGSFLLGALLVVSPAGITPAYADGPQGGGGPGIGWQYSESANGYYRPPQSTGGGGGGGGGPATVMTEWGSTPGGDLDCPGADPAYACEGDPGAYITGISCGAATGPRGLPSYPWIRYERTITGGEPGLWIGREADCDEPDEDNFIPMQEISWEVNYQVFQELNAPGITISPNARTLVNLPTIVWTDYPAGIGPPATVVANDPPTITVPIHIDRPNGGLDGEIRASGELLWTFEDGGEASGRGTPFVHGRLPENNPGYYVTNVFERAGTKTVTLNVRWTGTVTVPPLAPEDIIPVELPPVSEDVEVLESSPVLKR